MAGLNFKINNYMTINEKLDKEYGDGSRRAILIMEECEDGVTYIPGMDEIKEFIQSEVEGLLSKLQREADDNPHEIGNMTCHVLTVDDIRHFAKRHGFDLLKK